VVAGLDAIDKVVPPATDISLGDPWVFPGVKLENRRGDNAPMVFIEFVGEVDPRAVLLGHGDNEARGWFEQQIRQSYPKINVIQPQPGLRVEV
jgi:hypothetical protein